MPADSQRGVLYLFTTTRRPLANFPTQNKTWSKLLEKEQQLEDVINVGSQEQAFYVVLGLYPCSIFMATTSDDNKDVRARATSTEKGRQYCDAETGKKPPIKPSFQLGGWRGFPGDIPERARVKKQRGEKKKAKQQQKNCQKAASQRPDEFIASIDRDGPATATTTGNANDNDKQPAGRPRCGPPIIKTKRWNGKKNNSGQHNSPSRPWQ